MTYAIHEPCDTAQCPGCTARTCRSRQVGTSGGTRTDVTILSREQALTRTAWYESDDHIDGNGC